MSRLRRFLPPQVADLIVASGTEKQLESHRREITALFCDLRGFTGFSESSDPEDGAASRVSCGAPDVILAHGAAALAPLLRVTYTIPTVFVVVTIQSAPASLIAWRGRAEMPPVS